MVGSNVGWKVAPYLSVLPVFRLLAGSLTSVGDNVWIVPDYVLSDDNHNVMRGEKEHN